MYEALCDSFDTPKAIHYLAELVTATNAYIFTGTDVQKIKVPLVRQITRYILKVFKAFGIYEEEIFPQVGDS